MSAEAGIIAFDLDNGKSAEATNDPGSYSSPVVYD